MTRLREYTWSLQELNFSSHLQVFKMGEIMTREKCGYLVLLPEAFSNKVTPDIGFAHETVVQCGVSVVKTLF